MKMTKEKKKKLILIASICVVALIVCILIVSALMKHVQNNKNSLNKDLKLTGVYLIPDEIVEDTNRVEKEVTSESNCVDNICVTDVQVKSYDDRGMVFYKIRNGGLLRKSGVLKLRIGNYSTYILYDLGMLETEDGYNGFEKYNLQGATTYSVEPIEDYEEGFIKRTVPEEELFRG